MPEEGRTFIFGSWVCVADAQGGFRSHLDDSTDLEIIQSSVTNRAARLSDQVRRLCLDQEEIQFENFSNLEKGSEISHSSPATNKGKASMHDEALDDEPISIIGHHLGLMVASTSEGYFTYWKGLEPLELLGLDARLVAYIPNLP